MSSVGRRIEFLQCEQYKGAGLALIFSRDIAIILTSTYLPRFGIKLKSNYFLSIENQLKLFSMR